MQLNSGPPLRVAELFLALLYALTVRQFLPDVHGEVARAIHHIKSSKKHIDSAVELYA